MLRIQIIVCALGVALAALMAFVSPASASVPDGYKYVSFKSCTQLVPTKTKLAERSHTNASRWTIYRSKCFASYAGGKIPEIKHFWKYAIGMVPGRSRSWTWYDSCCSVNELAVLWMDREEGYFSTNPPPQRVTINSAGTAAEELGGDPDYWHKANLDSPERVFYEYDAPSDQGISFEVPARWVEDEGNQVLLTPGYWIEDHNFVDIYRARDWFRIQTQ